MEATCPRCSFTTPNVDAELQASGICPECGSQTYFSHGEPVRPNREGCVAATYEVDCAIGLPFSAVFVESRLPNVAAAVPPPAPSEDWGNDDSMSDDKKQSWPEDGQGGLSEDLFTSSDLPMDDSPTPGLFESSDAPDLEASASPPQTDGDSGASDWLEQDTGDVDLSTLPAQLQQAEALDELGHTPTGEFDVFDPNAVPDDADAESSSDTESPDTESTAGSPSSPDAETDARAGEDDGEDVELGDFDAPPAGEPEREQRWDLEDPFAAPSDSDAWESSASGEASAETPRDEEARAEGSSLPAHLQLPAIDFSLPTESTTDASVSASGASGGVELPAHLNLPSFPQFDLPPVPGEEPEEDRRLSDGTEVSGIEGGGGSFGGFDDTSGVSSPPVAAESGTDEGWSVGAPSAGPPPMPPPMPTKPKAHKQSAEPEGLPSLPSLPTLPTREEPKRDPTLIDRQVDEALQGGGGKGLYLAGGLLVLLLTAVVGAFLYKDALIETVADPNAGVDESTLKAQQIRIESRKLWADANALYEKKKLEEAIDKVHESLALDPAFGKSHRLLGVVYAELKRNEEAVQHYRRYLQLEPEASDAKDVRQIIEDYEKSKQKEAAVGSEGDNGKKRRRRR